MGSVRVKRYDVIVIGAGVVGSSVAFHLAALGAKSVLVLDRATIGAGTTAQSSGILRTHYSVRENVDLARRSWGAFTDFAAYVGDEDAASGLVPLLEAYAPPGSPVCAVYPHRRHLAPKVRHLIDGIAARWAAAPPWGA